MPSRIHAQIGKELLSNSESTRESRLHRRARRLGFRLAKSRNPDGWGKPTCYVVIDPACNCLLSSEYGMDLDELETWLIQDQLG
jgi:hypothetical protein